MDISVEELQKKVDEYFENISDEQLKLDCKKASIDFYNKIRVLIFSDNQSEDSANMRVPNCYQHGQCIHGIPFSVSCLACGRVFFYER